MLFLYIIAILVCHFFADWVFQNRSMANNKSRFDMVGWLAWAEHIIAYAAIMYIGMAIFTFFLDRNTFNSTNVEVWVFLNAFVHGIQDKITSQFTKKFYLQGREHAFFTVIGLDGLLHYIVLFTTAKYLFNL